MAIFSGSSTTTIKSGLNIVTALSKREEVSIGTRAFFGEILVVFSRVQRLRQQNFVLWITILQSSSYFKTGPFKTTL